MVNEIQTPITPEDSHLRTLYFGDDTETTAKPPDFNRSLAVIIGINNYQNVTCLKTAVNDATQLAELLKTRYDYEILLLVENVTQQKLQQLLTETLPVEVGVDDRVLFYFAGHGIALEGNDGPAGYLVPQDADPKDHNTLLEMKRLHDTLMALQCRHMLIILDCCFAGAMRWSTTRALNWLPEIIHRERYDRFIRDPAWQLLTSTAYDQKAMDILSGEVLGDRGDTQAGEHSPFALALFEALTGAADILPAAGDGIITATELYLYLRDYVEVKAEAQGGHRQTPGLWPLKKHDKGEYIFLVPGCELKLPPAPELTKENNPYRGLSPFEEEHQKFFFGRDEVIKELAATVSGQLLTVVLGVSGTGKSSLVKAGLIPYLKNAKILDQHGLARSDPVTPTVPDGGLPWYILPPIRPTKHPLRQLELILQDHLALTGLKTVTGDLSHSPEALTWLVNAWTEVHPERRLLLVIDQFEELVTLCESAIQRDQFLALLVNLVQADPERVHLALTLRSDFEPRFTNALVNQPSGLVIAKETWNKARFLVRAMTPSELRQAIEGPALAKVLYFDSPRLVDDLINEVSQTPSPLPLLSFTLNEMYLRYVKRQADGLASDRTMTRADYEALGGVAGSLQQRANKEYEQLKQNPAAQETMRRVMLRMLAVEGGEIARRRVPRSELEYADLDENERVETVLTNLERARLVVSGEMETEPYVEPAHDTLIQAWERLANWRAAEGDHMLLQRRVTQAAAEWARTGQTQGLWDDDPRLPQVEQILEGQEKQAPLSLPQPAPAVEAQAGRSRSGENWLVRNIKQVIKAFKNEAIQLADKYWLNRLELEFVRASVAQRHRDLRRLVLTVAGVMGVLAALTIFAFIQRNTAVDESNARGTAQAETQSEANARGTAQAEAQTEANARATEVIVRTTAEANAVDAEATAEIRRQEAEEQRRIALARFLAAQAEIIRTSPGSTGELAALLSIESLLRHPSLEGDLALQRSLKVLMPQNLYLPPTEEKEGFFGNDFWGALRIMSPDGRWVITKLTESTGMQGLQVRDATTGQEVVRLKQETPPTLATFSLDGHSVVASSGNMVYVWAVSTWHEIARLQHSSEVLALTFSSNGQWAATLDQDQIVRIWETTTWHQVAQLKHQEPVTSIAINPTGDLIAIATGEKVVQIWETTRAKPVIQLNHNEAVFAVTFSPDGLWTVTASGNLVYIWETVTGQEISKLEHKTPVNFVTFNADGRWLITATQDNAVQVWQTSPWEVKTRFLPTGEKLDLVSPSPDGRWITTVSDYRQQVRPGEETIFVNGRVQFWEVDTGQDIATLDVGGRDLAFSADGRWFAAETGSGKVRIWHLLMDGEATRLYHRRFVSSAVFSPDGKWLATGGDDATARVWDLSTGQELARLQHGQTFLRIAGLSPDGQRVAVIAGCAETSWPCVSTVGVWDWRRGREVRLEHSTGVDLPIFSPNGSLVLTVEHGCFVSQGTPFLRSAANSEQCPSTLRVWNSTTGQKLSEFVSKDLVNSAVFSSDTAIITVSRDQAVRIWDPLTGQEVNQLPWSYDVAAFISPNGRWVINFSSNKIAQVWEVATNKQAGQFQYEGELNSVIFSPDEKWVATISDQTLQVLSARTWQKIFLKESEQQIISAMFSPDGRWFLFASGDTVHILTMDGQEVTQLKHQDDVQSIVFSPNSHWVATTVISAPDPDKQTVGTTSGSTVHVWEVAGWKEITRLEHKQQVRSVIFSSEGRRLLTLTGNTALIWNWQYEDLIAQACAQLPRNLTLEEWRFYIGNESYRKTCPTLPAFGEIATSADPVTTTITSEIVPTQSHLPDLPTPIQAAPSRFLIITQDTAAQIHLAKTLPGHTGWVSDISFSPDGTILASSSADNTVRLWQVTDGSFIGDLTAHGGVVSSISFSPDGITLASSALDSIIRLWNLKDSTLQTLFGHALPIWQVAFSPDGVLLASTSLDKTIRLWHISDQSLLRTLIGHKEAVRGIAFSPDGTLLASASDDKTVRLWRVSNGVLVRLLEGHTDRVWDVVFSPDGTMLASGALDGTVRVWRVNDGHLQYLLSAANDNSSPVFSVAFSPDGTVLASGSNDGKIRLWRVTDGALLHTLEGHKAALSAVVFSPTGRILASAAEDNTVKLWGVTP